MARHRGGGSANPKDLHPWRTTSPLIDFGTSLPKDSPMRLSTGRVVLSNGGNPRPTRGGWAVLVNGPSGWTWPARNFTLPSKSQNGSELTNDVFSWAKRHLCLLEL